MNKFGSLNIKISLILSGVLIAIFVLYFTQVIVSRIQEREREIARLYGKALEYIANDENSGEYNFIFNEIIQQIDFPIIATNKDKNRIEFFKNIDIDTAKNFSRADTLYLLNLAEEMAEINPPIKVTFKNTVVLNYIHYGQSELVNDLKKLPYFEFLIGGVFLLLGYIGFSYIKKTEQSNIWVGLSRETAHQLGTPLTSLMGWLEILKLEENKSPELIEVTKEIESDLEKLNKIAGRFSKIGSQPLLTDENVYELIRKVADYFEKRIPTLVSADGIITKKVVVEITGSKDSVGKINKDLFEWVIENLLKNSLDAMDKDHGKIIFNISEKAKETCIDVSDNGKGIDSKFRKDVFRPGYSTKTRGWGLGLSLAKRIIENYHDGKLTLAESIPGKGTTFRIKLPR
ncbi:MAG: HAMP domain-containing histidine kinase [Bacteroidetes bacterium]|nr:HAMP domain-containing histidine kinase [Bacteroidota bacterium]